MCLLKEMATENNLFYRAILLEVRKVMDKDLMKIYESLPTFKIKPNEIPERLKQDVGQISFNKAICKIGDGKYYVGEWIVNSEIRHGRGIMFDKNSIYEGFFEMNQRSGMGRDITKDYVYQGYHDKKKNGRPSGHGILLDLSNSTIVKGILAKGRKPDGHCIMKFSDGTLYIGNFDKGIIKGRGKYVYPDGTIFDGEFTSNGKIGKGTFKDKEGNSYVGEIRDHKFVKKDTKNKTLNNPYSNELSESIKLLDTDVITEREKEKTANLQMNYK